MGSRRRLLLFHSDATPGRGLQAVQRHRRGPQPVRRGRQAARPPRVLQRPLQGHLARRRVVRGAGAGVYYACLLHRRTGLTVLSTNPLFCLCAVCCEVRQLGRQASHPAVRVVRDEEGGRERVP